MKKRPESIPEVANRLRLTREAFELNQALWCRRTGIGQQAWNNYERGRALISVEAAIKVCQAMGITMDWIYRGNPKDLPDRIAMKLMDLQKAEMKQA